MNHVMGSQCNSFSGYFHQQQLLLSHYLPSNRPKRLAVLTDGGVQPDLFSAAGADISVCVSSRPSLGKYDMVSHFENLPFAPKQLDVVVLWYIPSETLDWPKLLAEVDTLLADDGRLLVFGFHPWHKERRAARTALWQEAGTFAGRRGHLHRSTYAWKLKQYLLAQSFELVTLRRFGGPQVLAQRLLHPTGLQLCAESLFPWRYLGYLCVAQKQNYGMILGSSDLWAQAKRRMGNRVMPKPQNRGS